MHVCSWRHIEIFHAVMTTKNLTDAAILLKTSQPTVSRELARFEQLLKFKLFDRIKGRLFPTAQGIRLFEEVQRSYYGLERILNTADCIRQFEYAQLSITCLPVFSQSLLPKACHSFIQSYPDAQLTIIPQESPLLEEWLSAQRYDLGLTEHMQIPAGTERETLMTLNEVCVLPANHPLTQKSRLEPEDFHGQPFISLSITDSYRQLIDAIFNKHQVSRKMIMETHSAASVCAMIREGIGVSIVNPLTALDYLDKNTGLCIRPFSIEIPFTVSLIKPIHRPSSEPVAIFITHLKQQAELFPQKLALAFQH
ncbi:LysR family transcriptional regulator [Xenorhabdus cabanillasii]|uniref:Transcriptional activator protein lysR n=1 Tax=Xenorhabdus cabanillasii JM26 TaxID=1427517 RepID=W1J251_9GAMM|nr:LysR family transcriptional regulator [Xenorhabdus cabanillasii]PHM77534.1 LysR family transcriptional regulator [Xenorhabdus cabanillasii JM26]CDL83916.1 Transcriptional activator protein lysR [Xenorhabdus cabanillasii JM26]